MARVAIDLRETVEDSEPIAEAEGTAARVPAAALPDFPDAVEFLAAGSSASGEFRCADCGYGAVVQRVLPACPMCQGTVWEQREPLAARFPC